MLQYHASSVEYTASVPPKGFGETVKLPNGQLITALAMASSATFTMPARQLTWLITGCSSGIGLAITRRVLNEGHKVIATSRNPSRTPELVQEVESQGGRWVKLDVNEPDSGKVIENLEGEGSAVDVLVNNAGFSLHQVIEGFTEREARDQMETIFFGPFRLLRAAVPHMRRRRFGVVVNISAGAGLTGRETMGVYGAGKAAMDSKYMYLRLLGVANPCLSI